MFQSSLIVINKLILIWIDQKCYCTHSAWLNLSSFGLESLIFKVCNLSVMNQVQKCRESIVTIITFIDFFTHLDLKLVFNFMFQRSLNVINKLILIWIDHKCYCTHSAWLNLSSFGLESLIFKVYNLCVMNQVQKCRESIVTIITLGDFQQLGLEYGGILSQ